MSAWVYFILGTLLYIVTYQVGSRRPIASIALSLASLGLMLASVVKSFPNGNNTSTNKTPPSDRPSCFACGRKNLKT